ncbi:PadR family transcriptional regulator [Candidatus Micrarchaeota archaeon]|nr:PadR family transcriptional regulator [Candidatus Micrarchaeota archaeon]MBU1930868.1 PadR family transcriptional regulator [Candidatus Micrarchaeota archaeon]
MKLDNSPEIKRLEKKLGVELLWVFVLSMLKKEESHAYTLRKKIESEFGFLPGNVTAYVVLYKLQSRGFVSSQKEGNKVVYSITVLGEKLLDTAKKLLVQKSKSI